MFGRPVEALIGTGPDPGTVGEGVLRLLGLAADRPVAVFEDLDWADPDTRSIV